MSSLPLILASGSPRRRAFLQSLGLDFSVCAADIDETPLPNELPAALARRLAIAKAGAVGAAIDTPALILAADTVVALEATLLGKPLDAAEAHAMLTALRGRDHHVVTAISILHNKAGRQRTLVNDTLVSMRLYTNQEIEDYIATGDPFDKAGGYAIQHATFRPVSAINGCFAGVMGLPLGDLQTLLGAFGLVVTASLPRVCAAAGAERCCQSVDMAQMG